MWCRMLIPGSQEWGLVSRKGGKVKNGEAAMGFVVGCMGSRNLVWCLMARRAVVLM